MAAHLAIIADIGGTNTRVALADGAVVRTQSTRRYRNADHAGLGEVLSHFLHETRVQVNAACVAMAGPVKEGIGSLTNLDWRVDATEIGNATGAKLVGVLNDLQAQGHALAHVPQASLTQVLPGKPSIAGAAQLMLNVGTGLNSALVVHGKGVTIVPPSESGHVGLPVKTDADLRLAHFLSKEHGFAGAEEAASGRGLGNLYAWLLEEDKSLDPALSSHDVMASIQHSDRSTRAAALFVRMLGMYAGDLALIQLPFGGIFLCGGLARAFAPYYGPMGFENAFCAKGRFSSFMSQFPVHIVTDDNAALQGCAGYLAEMSEI
ncbi:MAG: glucokinase [Pseudoprimorskyibacter sp.]|nr:glucokinase [Pseudoprimorskyibacter sp.]